MSDLDQILARARDPGAFVERRRFSLNRAQAIEKLRAFSLRRPGQAVLELVQAAVHAGATYIAVDTSPDQLVVAWVGTSPIQDAELEHLFDYLFTDRGDRRRRHLVQLAIATNALLRSGGRALRIVSGDGSVGGTVRLDVEPDGSSRLGDPEEGLAGTFVALDRKKPWWSIFGRTAAGGLTEEQVLVEEQCRHTPVPILLNGSAPFGYRASRDIRFFRKGDEVSFDEGPGGRRGAVYLTKGESKVAFVVGGVRICTLSMPELGIVGGTHLDQPGAMGFSGVICDDDLRKTADQGDIVRDERFGTMLQAVRPHLLSVAHNADASWVPPAALDATPDQQPEAEEQAELKARYEQLAPRLPLSLSELEALPPELAIFRVDASATTISAMLDAADAVRLPNPILIANDPHGAALEARLGRPVSPLPDPGAVAMAARVHASHGVVRAVQGSRIDSHGRRWRAHVHLQGQALGLASAEMQVVLVRGPGRRPALRPLYGYPGVPGFLPEVELARRGDRPSDGALLQGLLHHAARLVLADESLSTAMHAEWAARVMRVTSAADAPLSLSLPPGWSVSLPGPSLSELAEAVAGGRPIPIDASTGADLWPIERRIGVGALAVQGAEQVIAGARFRDGRWEALPCRIDQDDLYQVVSGEASPVLVASTSPLRHPPEGWHHSRPTADPLLEFVGPGALPEGRDRAAAVVHDALLDLKDWNDARAKAARTRIDLALARWRGGRPTLASPSGTDALHGGLWPAGGKLPSAVPWALARTAGWLRRLGLPEWATADFDPSHWLYGEAHADGWLALPRVDDSDMRAAVVVDDGVVRRLVDPPVGFPVMGVLSSVTPLQRLARSLWQRALATGAIGGGHPWCQQAAKVQPADSLFLRQLLPGDPDRLRRTRSPFEALDAAASHAPEPAYFLSMQRDVLRRLLGQPVNPGSAPAKDHHLRGADPVRAPGTHRVRDGG